MQQYYRKKFIVQALIDHRNAKTWLVWREFLKLYLILCGTLLFRMDAYIILLKVIYSRYWMLSVGLLVMKNIEGPNHIFDGNEW